MRHLSILFLTLCMAVLLTGCKSDEQKQAAMPAPLVSIYNVKAEDCPWPAEFQATAAGSRAVEVRARVQGIIEKRTYREGDFIRQGELMFQLERAQYEAVYQQTVAAFDNADREWKRIRPLYAANAVSQKERDQALSNYDSTKAAMRQAKVNLDYCQVVAPVSGFTSKEAQTEGNLVSNTTLLTTVNQTDPMYIDFSIAAPERMMRQQMEREGRLRFPAGNQYRARLRLLDGRMYDTEGVVDFIDSQVQQDTGVIKARATFANDRGIIMPGQYVRVFMDGDVLTNAILIPQSCLRITSAGTFVMVVDAKNIAHSTKIEVGPFIGKSYLVLSGLKGGERIVSDGLIKTRDGAPVRFDNPAAPAQAGK